MFFNWSSNKSFMVFIILELIIGILLHFSLDSKNKEGFYNRLENEFNKMKIENGIGQAPGILVFEKKKKGIPCQEASSPNELIQSDIAFRSIEMDGDKCSKIERVWPGQVFT